MIRHRCYPSDTYDDEWALIEPLLPPPACQSPKGGRPEKHPRREIVDAIRYVVDTGCKWRALPRDFPPWRTCYNFMARWAAAGVVGQIRDQLRKRIRREMGRAPGAVATVIDSQSVKAAETVGKDSRGYDGAKKINGRYLEPTRACPSCAWSTLKFPQLPWWMRLSAAVQHGRGGYAMRVQRVLTSGSTTESWTLLGHDLRPVDPVESFLAYLTAIERSPNTVKAYAHDLKDWWTYLVGRDLDWKAVDLEAVAAFVAWLRLPPMVRNGAVAVLPTVEHHCTASSVNRKLAAVSTFYEFHARSGIEVAELLVTMRPAGRHRSSATSYKPFLQHIASGRPERTRTIKLKSGRKRPRVLTAAQAQKILDGCEHLRDRLLFALLLDTGVRIGEALGLRHDDIAIAEKQVTVVPRQNDNRARAKAGRTRTVPASAELMRLYSDYLHREYGALDSDYVFVNLFAEPHGHPWAYPAVYDLVRRLRKTTGVEFEPHQYRHTYTTWLLRRGAGMENVKELLGHASISTTIDTYGHLTVEDARRALEDAGWFTGREVRL